ncbi:hypothetical protein HK101_003378, partial [Irineochytrium annulatum]
MSLETQLGDHAFTPQAPTQSSADAPQMSLKELYLHFAITAGEVSKVILGDPAIRLDYCIHGACMSSLGPILDGTSAGELGIASSAMKSLSRRVRRVIEGFELVTADEAHVLIRKPALASLASNILSLAEGEVVACADIAYKFYRAWAPDEILGTNAAENAEYVTSAVGAGAMVDEQFVRRFVDQATLRKCEAGLMRTSTKTEMKELRKPRVKAAAPPTAKAPQFTSEFRSICI